MAKVYKINTGISNFNKSNYAYLRDTIYNILVSCFPDAGFVKTEYGEDLGITGPGLNASNTLFVQGELGETSSAYVPRYWLRSNDWGHQHGKSLLYESYTSSPVGNLCIYYSFIKNGLIMAACGETQNYKQFFTKAFIKKSNGNVCFYDFADDTVSDQIYIRNMMVAAYPTGYNPLPKAAPYITPSKISMAKMLLGSAIEDDIYVATALPNVSTSAQSFIIDDKEYVSVVQRNGYCPAVFKCTNS